MNRVLPGANPIGMCLREFWACPPTPCKPALRNMGSLATRPTDRSRPPRHRAIPRIRRVAARTHRLLGMERATCDGILINGFGRCLVLRRFAAKSACRRLQVPQCGHRRFPFLVNPGHSSKPRLVDVRPLLRSIRLFPNALRRRASMPQQSSRQLPPMQQQSPPFLRGLHCGRLTCSSYRKGLRQIRDPVHLEPPLPLRGCQQPPRRGHGLGSLGLVLAAL